MPVGKEAEVTDAHEAARKQVKQEAAQELLDLQSHEPLLVAMGGVSPLEGDIARGESDQPAVGDGDAMGVGAQIAQHMSRPSEGPLGVDDPVMAEQYPQPCGSIPQPHWHRHLAVKRPKRGCDAANAEPIALPRVADFSSKWFPLPTRHGSHQLRPADFPQPGCV